MAATYRASVSAPAPRCTTRERAARLGDQVDDVAHPPDVLEREVRRVVEVDVRLRRAVDRQQEAGRAVRVALDRDGYSEPLVDGTPALRGSRATASRSARATALNCASTTWCALRPASTRTCRQTCARRGERLPDVPGQRRVVGADQLDDLGLGVHDVRPAGQVDRGLHQRLVQRHQRVAEAADAGLVAERLAQRLADRDRGVLDGVVGVDLEVARGCGRPGRSRRACRAGRACGRRTARRCRPRCCPMPSSSSSTRTCDSLVSRSTLREPASRVPPLRIVRQPRSASRNASSPPRCRR